MLCAALVLSLVCVDSRSAELIFEALKAIRFSLVMFYCLWLASGGQECALHTSNHSEVGLMSSWGTAMLCTDSAPSCPDLPRNTAHVLEGVVILTNI